MGVGVEPVCALKSGADGGDGGRPDEQQVRHRVQALRKFRWSSYRAYVGLEKAPEWLNCEAIIELGGRGRRVERQQKYREYVEQAVREGLKESPWEHVQAQLVLGGREFLNEIRRQVGVAGREQPQRRALASRPSWEAVVNAIEKVGGEKARLSAEGKTERTGSRLNIQQISD